MSGFFIFEAIPAIRFNLFFFKEKKKRISPETSGLSGLVDSVSNETIH